MNERTRQQIDELLANPDLLIRKKPFTRGTTDPQCNTYVNKQVCIGEDFEAKLLGLL